MKAKIHKNSVKSEINIAPFTDVILVLLIIFMIATPVLMQPEIKINLPKSEVSDSEDTSNIEALISKNGRVYIDGKEIESSNVENVLRDLIMKKPGKSVVAKGDEKVEYSHIIHFMEKAKKAGATKLALAVEQKHR